jgi:serine/threonine protein kinase
VAGGGWFRREAEAAAKLHHTNIVPVYAIGEKDGTHFYAMELIEGFPRSRHPTNARAAGLSSSSLTSVSAYFDTVARMFAEVAGRHGVCA